MLLEKFDSHRPLQIEFRQVDDLQRKKPTETGWLFCCLCLPPASKPLPAVLAGTALQFSALFEIDQMGDGLAHGEHRLMGIGDFAGEQHRDQLGGGQRIIGAGGEEVVAALAVMLGQFGDAGVDAAEGQAVRGQDQGVCGQFGETLQRCQKPAERIIVAGGGEAADVGRDARQQHVAGDQYAEVGAIQAGVLRGVAKADDDPPVVLADAQQVVVEDAPEGWRDDRHTAPIGVAALCQGSAAHLVEAVQAEEIEHGRHAPAGGLLGDQLGDGVFAFGHPQFGTGLVLQPGGQAEVVGVEVGDDLAGQRMRRQDLLPGLAHQAAVQAGIDGGPAALAGLAVVDQPQVDVVEGKRQRHAQPAHTGRHFGRLAGGGQGNRQVVDGGIIGLAVGLVHG